MSGNSGERRPIITLDGPAGVGKSTLAKRLAGALGMAYLDTGAMFRTIGLHLSAGSGKNAPGAPKGAPAALESLAADEIERLLAPCVFALSGSGDGTGLLFNGRPVGNEIRDERAGMLAARAGRMPEVRSFLKKAQRSLGAAFPLVAEGRDMGTVVFPEAARKFFLDAAPEVRANRRVLQLREMGLPADPAEIAGQIRLRDEQDRNRAIAPLRPAEDALIIDTSHKSVDQVFAELLASVRSGEFQPGPAEAD